MASSHEAQPTHPRHGSRAAVPARAARLSLAVLLASTAWGCAGASPDSTAAAVAGVEAQAEAEIETVADETPTSVPEATEAATVEAIPIGRGHGAPVLIFQDAAACDDLAANGAEWAFIVAAEPAAGNRVASGFHARGCANVFEAALSWRLVDGLDAVIAEGFGTATCGTGCVGTFDLVVDYPPRAEAGIAYLEVFATSAEDGRPVHVNRIPLVLE